MKFGVNDMEVILKSQCSKVYKYENSSVHLEFD